MKRTYGNTALKNRPAARALDRILYGLFVTLSTIFIVGTLLLIAAYVL